MIDQDGLTAGEREYLQRAERSLRHVDAWQRDRLLDELRQHLEERPSTEADLDELREQLGPAEDYARRLLSEHHLAPPPRRQWPKVLAVATVLGGLVVGTIGYVYLSAEPDLHNPCGGVVGDGVEVREAAGRTEYVVPFRADGRLGLGMCPMGVDDGPTITGVHTIDPGASALAFVGTERPLPADELSFTGDASDFAPLDLSSETAMRGPDLIVWFEMRGCNTGGQSIDQVDVDYHWRGRNRTVTLPLGYTATVGESGCTRAEAEAWESGREGFNEILNREYTERHLSFLDDGDDLGLGWDVYEDAVGDDLCRYLRGIEPLVEPPGDTMNRIEPLTERAVFQVPNRERAEVIVIAAVEGRCPEFANRRDELIVLLDER